MLALILKDLGTREPSAVGCGEGVGGAGAGACLNCALSDNTEAFSTEVMARKKMIGQLIYKKLNLLL